MTIQLFAFDFFNEVQSLGAQVENRLRTEAEVRLRQLQRGYTDLNGAAVSVEQSLCGEADVRYRARVVAYVQPKNVAAVRKEDDAVNALRSALDAVERQVREQRAQLRPRVRAQKAHFFGIWV